MEYIYLIRDGAERSINNNVYKCGRSIDFTRRITQYHYMSQIICCVPVTDSINVEKLLLKRLKQTYQIDHGREHFIVDNLYEFINIFFEVVTPYIPTPDEFDLESFNENETHQLRAELWLKKRRDRFRK
jgi:hypothetical protein